MCRKILRMCDETLRTGKETLRMCEQALWMCGQPLRIGSKTLGCRFEGMKGGAAGSTVETPP
jgi:hypothetical protein